MAERERRSREVRRLWHERGEVHRAIQRKAPGVLFINARFDELSADQYEDLCYAIDSELDRGPAARRPPRSVGTLKLEV